MSTQTITLKGRYFDAVTGSIVPKPVETAPAKSTAKHAVKPSATLMRTAVKKPAHPAIKVQTVVVEDTPEPAHVITPKVSVSHIPEDRAERAKQAARNEKISRFGDHTPSTSAQTRVEHVPVQQTPEVPEKSEPTKAPEPKRTNTPDMFVQAIANASHFVDLKEHHARQKHMARRHAAIMTTGFAALLLIVGFATYINMPDLQLGIAGIRAGVSTAVPNFEKAGFSYAGVGTQSSGRVIALQSKGSNYQLLERATNWDGETMITAVSSVSANGTPNYTKTKVGTNTVYRFGTNQATWVKDGAWYNLSGEAAISDRQLTSLVENT